jgi:histone deacetylase complex subunit SAP18
MAGGFRGGPAAPPMRQGPPPVQQAPQPVVEIDREKVCPLLVRVFVKPGGHHRLEDFAIRGKEPAGDAEVQVSAAMRSGRCHVPMHA